MRLRIFALILFTAVLVGMCSADTIFLVNSAAIPADNSRGIGFDRGAMGFALDTTRRGFQRAWTDSAPMSMQDEMFPFNTALAFGSRDDITGDANNTRIFPAHKAPLARHHRSSDDDDGDPDGSNSLAAVPEPSTLILFCAGITLLVLVLLRKEQNDAGNRNSVPLS